MDKETWKREVFEPEAEIVRQVFDDAANGVSTKKIAATLTAKAVPSPGMTLGRKKASHTWFAAGIARIIRNRSYIGETTVNRSDKEVELDDVTPPIVSVELFEKANAALDNKMGRIQARNEQSFVMLRGIVFCMRCGSRCYPKSDGRGYVSFFCSSQEPERQKKNCEAPTLSERWLNYFVWQDIDEFLNSLTVEIRQRESEQINIPSIMELQIQFQYGNYYDWTDEQKRGYLLNWGFVIFIDGRKFEIRMRSGKLLKLFDESTALIAKGSTPCSDETISKGIVTAENAAIAQSRVAPIARAR